MANSADPDETARSALFAKVYVLICRYERVNLESILIIASVALYSEYIVKINPFYIVAPTVLKLCRFIYMECRCTCGSRMIFRQRLIILLTGLSAAQYRSSTCSVRVPIIWLVAD